MCSYSILFLVMPHDTLFLFYSLSTSVSVFVTVSVPAGNIGNSKKSSEYCRETLQRQLDAGFGGTVRGIYTAYCLFIIVSLCHRICKALHV